MFGRIVGPTTLVLTQDHLPFIGKLNPGCSTSCGNHNSTLSHS